MAYIQAPIADFRECRISADFGIAGANKYTASVVRAGWLQLEYLFAKNFSVALEGESSTFKLQGY
jgi:hypothetical protein